MAHESHVTVPYRPDGYEVFHWPETQAFFARLGIDMNQPIKEIGVYLQEGVIAEVTLVLHGEDVKRGERGPVDTTNLQNQQWRTKQPSSPDQPMIVNPSL